MKSKKMHISEEKSKEKLLNGETRELNKTFNENLKQLRDTKQKFLDSIPKGKNTEFLWENPLTEKTRENLERGLKNEPKITDVSYPTNSFLHSIEIYANPIIQCFFETSLYFSYVKNKEYTFKRAKTIFIKLCQVSLNLSLPNAKENEPENLDEFMKFISGTLFMFYPNEALHTFKSGRTKGKLTDKTKKRLELLRQGKSYREISIELSPRSGIDSRKIDIAQITKLASKYGLTKGKRKKTGIK